MEIRPEADAIISILPERLGTFIVGPPDLVIDLIQSFSDHDMESWAPYPVNASCDRFAVRCQSTDLANCGHLSRLSKLSERHPTGVATRHLETTSACRRYRCR